MKKIPLKNAAFVILVNLFFLSLGILALEFRYGNWRQDNGLIRLGVQRNIDVVSEDEAITPPHIIHYKRDANGLRGPFKDVRSLDLLTVGGSTTDQVELSEGETWQDVLAEHFHSDGKEIQIANGGIPGQSVYGHVRNFKLWYSKIPEIHAKYVLAYVGINDICVDPDFFEDYMAEGKNWKTLFKKRSALYLIYRKIRGSILYFRSQRYTTDEPESTELKWTNQPRVKNPGPVFEDNVKAYKKRIRRLLQRIREFHSIPIFVTQRTYSYFQSNGKVTGVDRKDLCHDAFINGVDEYYLMNLFNQATLDMCREEKLTCFDLAKEVEFVQDDFYDLMHNTPSGSKKIGDYLYTKLKPILGSKSK